MNHATLRLNGRIGEFADKIDLDSLSLLRERYAHKDIAVVIGKTGIGFQPKQNRNESNGDLVIAVIRRGTLCTVFYRRSSQPLTPEALRVEEIIKL
jgi:hypothetical protein